MKDFELQTEHLTIVPFEETYLNEYCEQFTEEITRLQYPDPFPDLEAARAFISEFVEQMEQGDMLELLILTKDRRFLGSFEIFGLRDKKPEVGLWLRTDVHGHGYGTEALRAVLDELERQGRYEAYVYEADRRNQASIALVSKFGAVLTGSEPVTTESGKELDLLRYEIPGGKNG